MHRLNMILSEIHEIERELAAELRGGKNAEKIRALKERLRVLQTEFKRL